MFTLTFMQHSLPIVFYVCIIMTIRCTFLEGNKTLKLIVIIWEE